MTGPLIRCMGPVRRSVAQPQRLAIARKAIGHYIDRRVERAWLRLPARAIPLL